MIKNLNEPVAKSNGHETGMLTRRAALLGISATVAAVPISTVHAEPVPTRDDMEDYFLFLWAEHRRVAEELGIDVFDHAIFCARGGRARYERECSAPAASRALHVLAQAGMVGGAA